jgi:hypothetical protein
LYHGTLTQELCFFKIHAGPLVLKLVGTYMLICISSVVEFQKWGVLNSKIFRQESTSVHQKLGIIVENKVVKKLSLENNVFFIKKWSTKLIFLNETHFLKKFD